MSMSIGETAQFLLGASGGIAVVFAALLASTASVRAGQSWAESNWLRATAFASFAGISGVAALGGMILGVVWVILNSPLAG
jgi:hypothetical protein